MTTTESPERSRRPRVAPALRDTLASGYRLRDLRADLLAGLVVGTVALPLSMALAIASGVPPEHGLATAVVAGALIATLGGSRVQVSGPTAAFVVVLAPIAAQHGLQGLAVATALAGLLLLALGIARLGRLIQLVPYPVTVGFTAGIGTVIALLQVKDALGLELAVAAGHEGTVERALATLVALPEARWPEAVVAVATFAILLTWRRLRTPIPAPLVALAIAALVAEGLRAAGVAGEGLATIASRFGSPDAPHGIPATPPVFDFPWNLPGPSGEAVPITFAWVRSLIPAALSIAVLGAIESLLSAVIADGMTGEQHDSDAELVAQGVGNVIAPFFGGIAATGALARTATNVRSGARSPLAAIVHAGFVLAAVLTLAPLLGRLPMAALAALLLNVAWNMAEPRHVLNTLRTAPRSDSLVMLSCLVLTVVFDMTVAVTAGIVMAAFLFMRRMIELTGTRMLDRAEPTHLGEMPEGLAVYEIAGPLFFGAAHKATATLHRVQRGVRVVLLDLSAVPVLDATGLVNLRSAVDRLRRNGQQVVLAGLQPGPRKVIDKAGLGGEGVHRAGDLGEGIERARALLAADVP